MLHKCLLRPLGLVPVVLAALALAGCNTVGGLGQSEPPLSAPTTPVQSQPLGGPPTAGMTIGTGPVKVALILPLTQASGPTVVGSSLRNAAELALTESGSTEVTFLVKDDRSTPDGAREAAQQALAEGAELIVGPLFANNVREVGRLARAANRPVIAFSTDAGAATRGVYLLSFMVESYVDRIVGFAASKGKKSIAVMAPENEYGTVALAEFQAAAARRGVRVLAIERYQAGGAPAAAAKIAALGGQIDALFIPEQAEAMPAVAAALTQANVSKQVQILGTGVWNDARVLKLPALQGAWFATPDNAGFNAFAGRYRAKFGSDPTRIATLAYDAASLAAALAKAQGAQRYAEGVLTNPSGFNGADGVFRFRAEGPNERGLAVMQITNGAPTSVSPAPRAFGPSGA